MFFYGDASVGWSTKNYVNHLCADTGYYLDDGPKVIADKNG